MKRASLALLFLLAGCDAAAVDEEQLPTPPEFVAAPVEPQRELAAPRPTATVGTLTPPEIVVAADQAHKDATGYVAWSKSKPENIDRLTTLTSNMNDAVARMRAGAVHGRYRPTDVVAARAALRELRSFLSNKGD